MNRLFPLPNTFLGEITILADQKVEDEVMDAGCFAAEVLEQIEIWSA